jgi:1,4-dihydroxy-2-naphthoate octaprenyltransferase
VKGFLAFVRLSRLKFLAGGLVAGALGGAVAAYETGGFAWAPFFLAQATVLAFHLMTHYANDYYDRAADEHAARTPFSGGSGVLVDGSLPPWVGLRAALACATLGATGCIALALQRLGPSAALAGAIGVLAWSYSAPPARLLARGLGEIDCALVVAILVPLCTYASQTGTLTPLALATTLPAGAAMFAMMLAVEYPDIAVDRATGKRNLVVRLGGRGALPLVAAACVAIYVGIALALLAGAPPALAFLELLALPLVWEFARSVFQRGKGGAEDAAIAGRGVALFFIVSLFALLAFLSGQQFA